MKHMLSLFVLGVWVLASGCTSGFSVSYDYDTDADFASFRTYDWIPAPTASPGSSAQAARQRSDLLEKRIKSAVDDQLSRKGLRRDSANPELLLAYHTGVQDKVDVTSYGYGYPGLYGGWYGSGNFSTYEYEEGTLIIDIVDAGAKQLVWRGTASKALATNPSPEQVTQTINDAVTKIFSKYPPKG